MKTFKLVVVETENGGIKMETEGKGFTALEILGALDLNKTDIIDQMYNRHPYTEIHHARKIITGDEIIEIVNDQEVKDEQTI